MSYADFLKTKKLKAVTQGPDITPDGVHPMLHEWQNYLVRWAVKVQRAAIWADTGLGKTFMQIEWARLSGGTSLIVAPLAVCEQTVRQAHTLGYEAKYVRSGEDITGAGIWVTNYEMVEHFDPETIDAVVLDESSILKQSTGKTRNMLIAHFSEVPARLACSATPAPNDPEELTNQAEFLGQMKRNLMLAAYFVHDQNNNGGYRLKGHATQPMMKWMTTWAVALRRPSDIGGEDTGYILPGLEIKSHLIPVEIVQEGQLFPTEIGGVSGRAEVRRQTVVPRCEKTLELVLSDPQWQKVCAKLATWHGNQNTQQTAEKNTKTIPSTESAESHREENQKKTRSTCASTTKTTKKSSKHTRAKIATGKTLDAARDTQTTLNIAQKSLDSPRSNATQKQSETTDSERHSASPRKSTMISSNCKVTDAQFAETKSTTTEGDGWPSITATTQDSSGEYSAQNATSDLESLRMIHSSWQEQLITSSELTPWLIWVGTNKEQEYLAKIFGDLAYSVTGGMAAEEKAEQLLKWADGDRPILITKPSIASMGMNFQHCSQMIFVGLGDSYEQYYQAIRRCYRYGQTRVVEVHIVLAEIESQIADNVRSKEKKTNVITQGLIKEMANIHNIHKEKISA